MGTLHQRYWFEQVSTDRVPVVKLKLFSIVILALITSSCANSNKLTTISNGLTQPCIDEKPQWVELAQNQGVYRCVSDIETRYTTTTVYVAPKPTATQEPPAPAITSPRNSGGSSGGSTNTKTVVSQYCNLSTTGMTSSWKGTMYSWVIYNQWSDGSKSVASSGFGYAGTVPYGC